MKITTAQDQSPIVIIGAGPIGLAAAAHLSQRQLPFLVLEAGSRPGEAMEQWAHVTLFSPWQYLVDSASANILAKLGWQAPSPHRIADRPNIY